MDEVDEVEWHYWAERDAADKLTIVHRSQLFSDWHGLIEKRGKGFWGRHVLQVVAAFWETHRMGLNFYYGDENVVVITYRNKAAEGEDDDDYGMIDAMPNTEDEFWETLRRIESVHNEINPRRKRRGRPIEPAIEEQQRKRFRFFLAQRRAGKTIKQAQEAVVEKYGVDRRTVSRDRGAHERTKGAPTALGFAWMTALSIYGYHLMGWRHPPRYSLCAEALGQYVGRTPNLPI